MKRRDLFTAGVAALGALAPRAGSTLPAWTSRLLLVGWDGAERAVVEELLEAGALPNLATLGTLVPIQVTTPHGENTTTKPGWTKVHTGLGADVTGVMSNSTWQTVPAASTLSGRWAALGANLAWVVAKPHTMERDPKHDSEVGPLAEAARLATVRYELLKRDPGLLAMALVPWLLEWRDTRWFAFWHSHEPDSQGHQQGVNSPAYREALMRLDTLLGVLRAAAPTATVVVTTDHGFGCPDDLNHDCSPNGWVVSSTKVPTSVVTLTQLGQWLKSS